MFSAEHISYGETGAFTTIVQDYLSGSSILRPFYAEQPSLEGIRNTIERKKEQPVDRRKLFEVLTEQYQLVPQRESVMKNISLLKKPGTFTVCTAHQPNLFTGPLYFIYKILHTIRLAQYLNEQHSDFHFVPVYYMGSEDADFAELNHTYVDGKKNRMEERAGWRGRKNGGGSNVDQTC